MNIARLRRSLLALASLLIPCASAQAQGAPYPNHAIRLVVPYSAGGIADVLARVVAERLSVRLGQNVVIDNRAGAGGHVGGEFVAAAPADGYTLMLGTIAHNGAVALYRNLRYDPTTALKPVILIAESPSVLLVNQALPVQSVGELLALARARPGYLSYGSAGNGSAIHMAAELFKYMTRTDIVHIPYKGAAPAMTDLLSGQIPMLFESAGTAPQHVKSGRVRVLAVTSAQRLPSMPEVPTLAEAGVPGYAAVPWYTISVARDVPAEIVQKLNAELNAVLKAADLVQRWEPLGVMALGGTPEDAVRRNRAETERWTAVINAARLSAD